MTDYEIVWDSGVGVLPPAGNLNPDGVGWASIRDQSGRGIYGLRLIGYADAVFAAHRKPTGRISVPLVLIPRPDDPFNGDAVSIALAEPAGGDSERRCIGYLYRHTTDYSGIANDGRKYLVARLAAMSTSGDVRVSAVMSRDFDPAELAESRCPDDEGEWDIACRLPDLVLDLPKAPVVGSAIRAFLEKRQV